MEIQDAATRTRSRGCDSLSWGQVDAKAHMSPLATASKLGAQHVMLVCSSSFRQTTRCPDFATDGTQLSVVRVTTCHIHRWARSMWCCQRRWTTRLSAQHRSWQASGHHLRAHCASTLAEVRLVTISILWVCCTAIVMADQAGA